MTNANQPNVLILFTDDQRFDTLGAAGNPQIKTPNMDRLVREGTWFTRAHIPCGTSGAVCMPSRAMLHTGRTLFHLQGAGEEIPADHTTLGEHFRKNGYRTFGAGKWHNGRAAYHRSFTNGAEIFFGGMADHWNVPAYHFDPTGRYDTTRRRIPDYLHSNETEVIHSDHVRAGEHSTDVLAGEAIRWLERQDGATPFLAYVAFLAPHDPRSMPDEFRQMYDPESIELPPNFCGGHAIDTGALRGRDETLAGFPRLPHEIRRHIAEYYAMISHLDHQFGRILACLEQKGLRENTIIVFAGDNGLALGQHGLMGKQSCYDHSVRVPLVFSGPGVKRDNVRTDGCYLLDLYPTLCDLCGLDTPGSVDGQSLLPALQGKDAAGREELFFAFARTQRAYEVGGWKLIEYVSDLGHIATQLFNLRDDKWEMNDLANDPACVKRLHEMRRGLRRMAVAWDDPATEFGQAFWSRVDLSLFEG